MTQPARATAMRSAALALGFAITLSLGFALVPGYPVLAQTAAVPDDNTKPAVAKPKTKPETAKPDAKSAA